MRFYSVLPIFIVCLTTASQRKKEFNIYVVLNMFILLDDVMTTPTAPPVYTSQDANKDGKFEYLNFWKNNCWKHHPDWWDCISDPIFMTYNAHVAIFYSEKNQRDKYIVFILNTSIHLIRLNNLVFTEVHVHVPCIVKM